MESISNFVFLIKVSSIRRLANLKFDELARWEVSFVQDVEERLSTPTPECAYRTITNFTESASTPQGYIWNTVPRR